MQPANFSTTINLWLTALDSYNFPQLLLKPSPSSWSVGQVYMHLIENTDWFFEQIRTCISCNDNEHEEATDAGKQMLLDNSFPDMQLVGPTENDFTPQPPGKKIIFDELNRQKMEAMNLAEQIKTTTFQGKTKHPGLNYFNANEWLRFAEMHLRHHLRQKNRIDEFLKSKNS